MIKQLTINTIILASTAGLQKLGRNFLPEYYSAVLSLRRLRLILFLPDPRDTASWTRSIVPPGLSTMIFITSTTT